MSKLTGRGGPGRGQGRHKEPPEQHRQKRLISLPPEIAAKLDKVENVSKLITQLLTQYFMSEAANAPTASERNQ